MPQKRWTEDELRRTLGEERWREVARGLEIRTEMNRYVETTHRASSSPEEDLARQISDAKLPEANRQYRFHPGRRWKADFVWLGPRRVLVEVDGGVWKANKDAKRCEYCKEYPRGRHLRPEGYENDIDKLNEAALLGYLVLRFTSNQVRAGVALPVITRALKIVGVISQEY